MRQLELFSPLALIWFIFGNDNWNIGIRDCSQVYVFTPGGSFSLAQNTLSGQAQKAIFRMNSYLYKFTDISPYNRLELFDKLVAPIMNYSAENWAKQLLGCLGFNEVWVAQTVGDVNIFLSLVKQRLHDNFIQNLNSRLRESSRASFYSGISSFHFQHY